MGACSVSCTPLGSFTDRMSCRGRKGEPALIIGIMQIQRKIIGTKEKCELYWRTAKVALSEALLPLPEGWI